MLTEGFSCHSQQRLADRSAEERVIPQAFLPLIRIVPVKLPQLFLKYCSLTDQPPQGIEFAPFNRAFQALRALFVVHHVFQRCVTQRITHVQLQSVLPDEAFPFPRTVIFFHRLCNALLQQLIRRMLSFINIRALQDFAHDVVENGGFYPTVSFFLGCELKLLGIRPRREDTVHLFLILVV